MSLANLIVLILLPVLSGYTPAVHAANRYSSLIESDLPDDTGIVSVRLSPALTGKIIEYHPDGNSIIYIQWSDARALCQAYEGSRKDEYDSILRRLDFLDKKVNALKISGDFGVMNYIVADLLRQGHAKVYDNKVGIYIEAISYHTENASTASDRVFYFMAGAPFFTVRQYSGIVDQTESSWHSSAKGFSQQYDMFHKSGQ